MTVKRIFITGASGCIGHYVVEWLLNHTEHQLFVLVRNPDKLRVTVPEPNSTVSDTTQRLQVLQGDLRQISRYDEILQQVDVAILLAAAWGGWEETYDTNVNRTIQILKTLGAGHCQNVLYFSTESILDQHNKPLREALEIGTDYIRTKAIALQQIERLTDIPPIVAIFPTLVFGGDQSKPASHLTSGLGEVLRWLWLARFLSVDASFHFMHASDIAQVAGYLVDQPVPTAYCEGEGVP
ncbi:MAG: NAD(P)-dependent oxidoreductase, partial [Cyanobacteria bacterium P01_H01_bin.121]